MPLKTDDSVHILEGKAILYKREGTPAWQVRYKGEGKKLRNTTHEVDLDKAKKVAVDIVTNAWYRVKNDLPVVNKHFKAVADLAIKRMEEMNEAGHGKATFRSYILALKNYHIPYLGKYLITKIDYALLQRFSLWRDNTLKHRASASTINTHNSALNRVFDEALIRGYITKTHIPVLTNRGVETQRRPDITEKEYKHLYTSMREWVKTARKGNESTLRYLLRDYVLILANTGMRPGTESMNLKWQHITVIEHDGKNYLEFNISGKTGRRKVLVRHRVARYLERIKERDEDLKDMTLYQVLDKGVDKYIFRVDDKDMSTAFGRMFARLLESIDLAVDKRTDDKRTLYSIRHFYATRALTRTDITPYQLADFMGTSVGMLKAHYGHLDLRQIADKFAGTGTIDAELRKPKQQDDDEDVVDVKKSVKKKTVKGDQT